MFVFIEKSSANCFFVNQNDPINPDTLILFSKQFLEVKYKYSSCNPKIGFDCSGFVYFVFNYFHIKVPRSSIDFGNIGKIVSKDSAKIGDVIVFTGTNAKNRHPGHVGIVISTKGSELTFIHSSSNKKKPGVRISNFKDSPYYEKRFLKIVRVAEFN